MLLDRLPCSRPAIYNLDFSEKMNLTREQCTPNTRVAILEKIRNWAKDCSINSPPVYWLNGPAGTGKSTIAYTIAHDFDDDSASAKSHRILMGTFFCSRQLEDTRRQKYIIPTLVHQLAHRSRSFAQALDTNKLDAFDVVSKQITDLLVNPWKKSAAERPKELPPSLIIIDALDEIEDEGGSKLLKDLLQVIHQNDLRGLKFLVTSRPDPSIVTLCKSLKAVCHLHEVDTKEVEKDIMKFLVTKLPALQAEQDLADFAQRAGGLFIYAATGVRYLSPSQPKLSLSEQRVRLKKLLKGLPQPNRGREVLLVDTLYQQILSSARGELEDDEFQTRLDILHAILCARTRISASTLANILNSPDNPVEFDTVETMVQSLHAVLYVSTNDCCIYWYHASFQDFVFDARRSQVTVPGKTEPLDASCDQPSFHARLAQRCFDVMRLQLRFNICELPSSYLLDSEVNDLKDRVSKISEVLQYSCQYWGQHLVQATDAKTDDTASSFRAFLYERLLFWFEVMNLIGSKASCDPQLRDASLWLGKVCFTSHPNYPD